MCAKTGQISMHMQTQLSTISGMEHWNGALEWNTASLRQHNNVMELEVHVRDQCELEEWMYEMWFIFSNSACSIPFSLSFKSFFSLHCYPSHVTGNLH